MLRQHEPVEWSDAHTDLPLEVNVAYGITHIKTQETKLGSVLICLLNGAVENFRNVNV